MNEWICYAVLLAQRGRIDSLSRGFRKPPMRLDPGNVAVGLLLLAGAILAIWLLVHLLKIQERRGGYISAATLFLSLCRAHRVGWSQRWLLWRVARAQQLREPARLFLEPERLDAARLGPALQTYAAALDGLRQRFFAEMERKQDDQDSEPPKPNHDQPAATPLMPSTAGPALDLPPWTATSPTMPKH